MGVYHTHLTLCQVWSQQDSHLTVDLLLESSIMQALILFTTEHLEGDKLHSSLRVTLEGTAMYGLPLETQDTVQT